MSEYAHGGFVIIPIGLIAFCLRICCRMAASEKKQEQRQERLRDQERLVILYQGRYLHCIFTIL